MHYHPPGFSCALCQKWVALDQGSVLCCPGHKAAIVVHTACATVVLESNPQVQYASMRLLDWLEGMVDRFEQDSQNPAARCRQRI